MKKKTASFFYYYLFIQNPGIKKMEQIFNHLMSSEDTIHQERKFLPTVYLSQIKCLLALNDQQINSDQFA